MPFSEGEMALECLMLLHCSSQFEAVELAPIMNRAGFDPNSAAVPAP